MPDLCIRQIRKRIPAARDDACKEWQEVSTQPAQTDDVKGNVRSFGSQDPETDWDDKPGLPRLVIPVRFGFFGPFRPENIETDRDDKPGLPRLVTPVRFKFFWPFSARKPRNGLG